MNQNQIQLTGGIGPEGINAASVQAALAGCSIGPVEILLDSQGGVFRDAVRTIAAIQSWPCSVSIHVCGQASSGAALIVASFPSTCEPTARFLLHRPSVKAADYEELSRADNEDLNRDACDLVQSEYVSIMAKRMNLGRSDIKRLLAMSIVLTAQEARNIGLVHRIVQREIVRCGGKIGAVDACIPGYR